MQESCMAKLIRPVAEEEVKFSLDAYGHIPSVSKSVAEPVGEAIGIDLIRARDLELVSSLPSGLRANGLFRARIGDRHRRGLALSPVINASLVSRSTVSMTSIVRRRSSVPERRDRRMPTYLRISPFLHGTRAYPRHSEEGAGYRPDSRRSIGQCARPRPRRPIVGRLPTRIRR